MSAVQDDWLSLRIGRPRPLRQKLAERTRLPEQFLDERWEQHPRRPDFNAPSGRVLLHAHCHQKAMWGAGSSAGLLTRIVGDSLEVLDAGCCGMAGSFGYTRDRFDLSMRIGEQRLMPAARSLGEGDTLLATGTSCRHQVWDGVGQNASHPMAMFDHLVSLTLTPPPAPQ